MNAPLSSSESIIAGRFCPRACSAVGTCLRNCKETGSAASGRVHQSENISKRRSEPRETRVESSRVQTTRECLVVKLMRRRILSSLYLLPAEGFVAYSPSSVCPPKLRGDAYIFFQLQRAFFFWRYAVVTKIKFIDFFSHRGPCFPFQVANRPRIPSTEFPLINFTDWFLVRCATGRNRRRYANIHRTCANEKGD